MKWSEKSIYEAVGRFYFKNKHLLVVPCCKWTGHESDVLCVTNALKVIDFEIKISRSDFLADAKKAKWHVKSDKVWKHYYIMPDEIWNPDMPSKMANPDCGILTIYTTDDRFFIVERKKAVGNKSAKPITAKQVIEIARLVSLRFWRT